MNTFSVKITINDFKTKITFNHSERSILRQTILTKIQTFQPNNYDKIHQCILIDIVNKINKMPQKTNYNLTLNLPQSYALLELCLQYNQEYRNYFLTALISQIHRQLTNVNLNPNFRL